MTTQLYVEMTQPLGNIVVFSPYFMFSSLLYFCLVYFLSLRNVLPITFISFYFLYFQFPSLVQSDLFSAFYIPSITFLFSSWSFMFNSLLYFNLFSIFYIPSITFLPSSLFSLLYFNLIYSLSFRSCPINYTCFSNIGDNPNHGYTNFDSFPWALVSTIQLVTADYWENVYEYVCLIQMLFFPTRC